jgi:5-methyltetrahydropteroyltriglutamate--homocysteine methyltransferase
VRGGYDAVQEILFNKINVHGYFMEYDDARSGGFEPLRMLPRGKQAVLGIVTTKTGTARKQGRPQATDR